MVVFDFDWFLNCIESNSIVLSHCRFTDIEISVDCANPALLLQRKVFPSEVEFCLHFEYILICKPSLFVASIKLVHKTIDLDFVYLCVPEHVADSVKMVQHQMPNSNTVLFYSVESAPHL